MLSTINFYPNYLINDVDKKVSRIQECLKKWIDRKLSASSSFLYPLFYLLFARTGIGIIKSVRL
jgi:hypothetical protein